MNVRRILTTTVLAVALFAMAGGFHARPGIITITVWNTLIIGLLLAVATFEWLVALARRPRRS